MTIAEISRVTARMNVPAFAFVTLIIILSKRY